MNLLKKIGLVGVTLASLAINANAGVITLKNSTPDLSVGVSTLTTKNLLGATDSIDTSFDLPFQSSTYTNALNIYTKVEGTKLSTDARPRDTEGWDFYLGVKGSVSGIDNYLRYKITDTTDLVGKTLTIYDTENPSVTHTLLMDGAYHNISLPALTASNGEYAHWRLSTVPVLFNKPGDTNLDGIVDAADYINVKRNFGVVSAATWGMGDFDGDKDVDYTDLQTLMGAFGNTSGIVSASTPANTPEPTTMGLLALGGLAALASGRKKR